MLRNLCTFALVKIRKTYTLAMLKGLLRRHFSIKNSVEAKKTPLHFYNSFTTNLLFTSLASEFNNIYQECAKKSYKNILGDYSSDYKSRLRPQ